MITERRWSGKLEYLTRSYSEGKGMTTFPGLIFTLSSPSSTALVEDDPSSPDALAVQSEPTAKDARDQIPHSGCKTCGREEIEKGCNGEGRIQGGIATIPGFGWWPIKAYRPCPGFVASGGRYRRQGQSMNEVAFGRGGDKASVGTASSRCGHSVLLFQFQGVSASATILVFGVKNQSAEIDAEIRTRIEKTVRRILEESDLNETTESKIRKQASKELDLDLSAPHYKALMKQVVESFLEGKQEQQHQQEESTKQYDDDGDLEFRGKTLVSLREYYRKDGKELPSSKGISLTEEQWPALKKNVPAIEKATKKMESGST
ncbi:hypothetical protein L6164_019337 [Bauhinia variegata]|uniref:Uncharacterized protein n=1 Tax=Bauhinia variegata TaxID=167791 RepID=A0ACB9MUX9_BAUVA|nr:hypothetical protein L6164_019337 [Bauhinia variegata]